MEKTKYGKKNKSRVKCVDECYSRTQKIGTRIIE